MQNPARKETVDFSSLDQFDFRERYLSGPEANKARFYVEGIRCGKCIRKLESLPISVPGLTSLRIEMGKNLAHAELDTGILKLSELAQKISDLGFTPIPVPQQQNEEVIRDREDRRELIRLGVAGACAGNIMTFSFATYLGDSGTLWGLFSWLAFALYLPVVTYVAWPFYVGAWKSLRQKQISIDLPMTIASLCGFLFSSIELWRGQTDIYFDSLSGFLFLILVSRWAQKRLQRRLLRPQELTESFHFSRVRIGDAQAWAWAPTATLEVDQDIVLREGDVMPADAELLDERAHFGMAWLTGEVHPKSFRRAAIIPAGARVMATDFVHVRVRRPLPETEFGRILQEVQGFALAQNRLVTQADRWAQWLLGGVFAIAVFFLFVYLPINPQEAIRRSLALIILACPCAMAFGTPLALATALKKSRARGLIVRNANAFEKAATIRTIFFDKTGTLTDSDLKLVQDPAMIPEAYQRIILSLENESIHPIAFSFRKAFANQRKLGGLESGYETVGQGVFGTFHGRRYALIRDTSAGPLIACVLFEDDNPLYRFTFEAEMKPDCLAVLNELRDRGYRLILLSGDKEQVVENLAMRTGFPPEDSFSAMDPAAKAARVAMHPQSMMVGDGVNDSLAMMKASVSVAVSGGVEAALKCSDVYLTDSSLKGVTALLDLSRESLSLIRQNLTISLIYNVVGGTLALMGFINPLVAAVLMPISTGFILAVTWLKARE